jgi:hypothetical protein
LPASVGLDNSRWLAGLLDERGWPGWKLAGDEGARAAWLIAQHADQDPVFQRRCVDLLSTAVAGGDASPAHLAYLTDRVQLKELGYQTYGTQYQAAAGTWRLQTVNEPESLEERRQSVGLPPIAEEPALSRKPTAGPNIGLAAASSGSLLGLWHSTGL